MQKRRRPGYHYWFPARQTGWGWGMPQTWQGWLVLDAYIGILIISIFIVLFGGQDNVIYGLVGITGGTVTLIWICNNKGEPRRRHLGR